MDREALRVPPAGPPPGRSRLRHGAACRGTPFESAPYRELGLRDDEYARIQQILGRRPTESELAMYAIMWSEHCSYKSSKVHLRQFGREGPGRPIACWPASGRTPASSRSPTSSR